MYSNYVRNLTTFVDNFKTLDLNRDPLSEERRKYKENAKNENELETSHSPKIISGFRSLPSENFNMSKESVDANIRDYKPKFNLIS